MPARAAAASLLAALTLAAAAQAPITRLDNDPALDRMAGCALDRSTYHCSLPDLQRALVLTSTIRIENPPNHASDAAVTDLIHRLGKQIATPDQQAGLIFTLEPAPTAGIDNGTSTPLARLRVLIADHRGGADKLLWVETYTGDPSRPWPLIARATTQQFLATAHTRP